MKTLPVAALLLVAVVPPALAQATDQPFFSGTIPVDPALVGKVPSAEERDATTEARTQPLPSDTVSLTAEQREAAIEAGARAARDLPVNGASDGKIHGEMGVEIGTGGHRAVYGTAVVPIGETGTAAFSFETDRNNYKYRRPR